MQNYMKTILSAVQTWTGRKIKESIADWNENDSSKSSYVKNRTHWEEKKTEVLVDNLTDNEYSNGNAPQCNFVPGNKYTVIWNGIEYADLVCYFGGDFNIIGGQDKFPFYIDDDDGNGLYIEAEDVPYTVSIIEDGIKVHKLDKKYLDLPTNLATTDDVESAKQEAVDLANNAQTTADGKMDKSNPVGIGSFSMNRKADTTIGPYSHAEGYYNTASGWNSHAEGEYNVASETDSHAEGFSTTASGMASHAEGNGTTASGAYSHAEGEGTVAGGKGSHAGGMYNISDTSTIDRKTGRRKYTHIIGNGTSDTARSNAHTLDWNGVGWFQGGLQVGGTVQDGEGVGYVPAVASPVQVGQILSVKAIDENGKPTEWEVVDPWVITSSTEGSTKKFKISIDDTGTLIVAEEVE